MAAAKTQVQVNKEKISHCCDGCGKESNKKCTGCKLSTYCSRECQVKEWPTHKLSCKTKFYGLLQKYWMAQYRVLPRVRANGGFSLHARTKIPAGSPAFSELSSFATPKVTTPKHLRDLWRGNKNYLPPLFEAFRDVIPDPSEKPHLFFDQVLRTFGYHIGTPKPKSKEEEEEAKRKREEAAKNGELDPTGQVEMDYNYVYGVATSMARHSCRPNCHITPISNAKNPGKFIFRVVALMDIEVGDEITISFHDSYVKQDRQTRLASIQDAYGYTCICPLCQEGDDTDDNKLRKELRAKHLDLIDILSKRLISSDSKAPQELVEGFDVIEKITRALYPEDEYKINPAMMDCNILRIKVLDQFGVHEAELLESTLKLVDLLQTELSPLYKEIRDYFSPPDAKKKVNDLGLHPAVAICGVGQLPSKV